MTSVEFDIVPSVNFDTKKVLWGGKYNDVNYAKQSTISGLSVNVVKKLNAKIWKRTDATGKVDINGNEFSYRFEDYRNYFCRGDEQLYRGPNFYDGLLKCYESLSLSISDHSATFSDFKGTVLQVVFNAAVPKVVKPIEIVEPVIEPDEIFPDIFGSDDAPSLSFFDEEGDY